MIGKMKKIADYLYARRLLYVRYEVLKVDGVE